jgi:predicted CXXCH cytochrome family protein
MFKRQVRYAAFQQIDPKAGEPLKVQLKLAAMASLDPSCLSCHPSKPTSVNPVVRCAHKSGVPVKKAQVDRVRAFNRENEALKKAGKPAMPPIILGESAAKTGLFAGKSAVLACTSCHTNHVDTGIRKYVLMPFDDPSTLCRGCHV